MVGRTDQHHPAETGTDAQPQLCFGQVRHKRLRPAVHVFEYRAYYLRLPLRSMGARDPQCALFSRNRFNLLSFYDGDHGDGTTGLVAWIDALLEREGVHDAGGEVWLQAMPRVLGFVFNPVSFWFCHSVSGELRAVLCDVRNVFGERHFYFLDDGFEIPNGGEITARKLFHMSPFCAVDGGYRFRFMRVMRMRGDALSEHTVAAIDYDDPEGPVLQTSVSGFGAPIACATVATAFFTYPLLTLGVVARLHLQALRLWFKGVPLHSKPPPPPDDISR